MVAEEKKRVLVVDDEASIRESLRLILSRHYEIDVAENGDRALEVLTGLGEKINNDTSAAEVGFPDLVLLDVMMPGLDGLGLLEKISSTYPKLPVIMLTASNAVKSAVQAMKIGAVDYLSKPFDVDELLNLIQETLVTGPAGRSSPTSVQTVHHARPNLKQLAGDYGCVVGQHPVMAELYRKLDQLAARDTTVLITGESGTGKELVARELHQRSPRAAGPFVALNCAAIPDSLIESELFGHEKGSFTHAVDKRVGHFELADKGTLFLDEIGELSPPVQVKMLRFLQEQEFYRLGRSKPIRVDVRILAATNQSLETAVKEGRFRQDLFYRINVVTLDLPPLRERLTDVPALASYFAKRLAPLYGGKERSIESQAFEILQSYSWPGNVRELENIIESALALSSNEEIRAGDLPARLRKGVGAGTLVDSAVSGDLPFEEAERAFETEIILRALNKTDWIQTRAAELLGISRRILKYKMDKLGITEPATTDGSTRDS